MSDQHQPDTEPEQPLTAEQQRLNTAMGAFEEVARTMPPGSVQFPGPLIELSAKVDAIVRLDVTAGRYTIPAFEQAKTLCQALIVENLVEQLAVAKREMFGPRIHVPGQPAGPAHLG